jgi:XTP/dITP diphosphohydrolase
MPRTLVIGTRNRGKFREIAAILGPLDVDLVPLDAFDDVLPVPETGDTFEANARAKALGYARATDRWTLADDSGLEVDALGGAPGVRSARWGGEEGNDALNNAALMRALADHPPETWTARFRCVMALATPDRILAVTEGACEGVITDTPAGSNGFGYDPHFYLPDRGRTMAQLPPEKKNRISHRALALAAMKERLAALL